MPLGYEQLKKDFQDAADEKEKAEAAANPAPVEKPAAEAEKDDDGGAD